MPHKRILFVLGHKLTASDQPSSILRERVYAAFSRIEEAFEASFQRRTNYPSYGAVVLCGGKSHLHPHSSEAAVMKRMLSSLCPGILPPVLLDETSHNTLENLMFGTDVLMKKYPRDTFSLEIVTHPWHQSRVDSHWRQSRFLKAARQRCKVMNPCPMLHGRELDAKSRLVQRLANMVAHVDHNRTLVNMLRPHSA